MSEMKLPETVIRPLATPYQALMFFEYDDLQSGFDEYWEAHKEGIVKKYNIKARTFKGGYSPSAREMAENRIGLKALYSDVFLEKIVEKLNNEDQDFLHLEQFHVNLLEKEVPVEVSCTYYKFPYIEFRGDLNMEIENPVKETFEEHLEVRKKHLIFKNREIIENKSGVVEENSTILLDLIKGTNDAQRGLWYDYNEVPEYIGDILGKSKGGQFEAKQGEDLVIVNIVDVRTVLEPEYDDSLCSDFGGVEGFEAKIREGFDSYVWNAKMNACISSVIDQIATNSDYGPVPQNFIDRSVDYYTDNHMNSFGGDEKKAYTAIGVSSREEMENKFIGEIMRQLAQKLSLKAYARMHSLDEKDVKVIQDHIMEKTVWV